MATLNQPHWDKIPSLLREILLEIGRHPFVNRFYLSGGTALALQLGHRVSVDLDFFSTTDELEQESRQEIIAALQQRFSLEVDEGGLSSLLINIQNSYVGFFGYSYPLLAPTVMLEGIKLAGFLDIGLMKMDAVAGRGSRKDFYDLYFIGQQIPLEEMLDRGKDKYPYVKDFGMMVLAALTDFSIAERQVDIVTTPEIGWDVVKQYFVQESRRIGRNWFQ